MGRHRLNLAGEHFGFLTVLTPAGVSKHGHALWNCRCDCGNKAVISAKELMRCTPHCGCRKQEGQNNPAYKHGMGCTPENSAYGNARRRCIDRKNKFYPDYGGRGIRFLFTSFEQFFAELGPRPSPEHSLDRKNNDGHYALGNCRWATKSEQRINQRSRPPVTEETKKKISKSLKRYFND